MAAVAPPPPANAVALVAGAAITPEMLRQQLRRQQGARTDSALTADQKRAALETLIRNEAIYAKARAAGFDQNPDMQARIKSLVVGQYKEQQFQQQRAAVTDAELEHYHQANSARFAQPASARGAAIFVRVPGKASPEKQAEFQARAEEVLTSARSNPESFPQLAARYSDDPASRYRGGDTGWVTSQQRGLDPALAQALFALEHPGDFAPLVKANNGFYIVRLTEKRAAGHKSLAEVKEALRYEWTRQREARAEADFYATMKAGLDIQINEGLLESVTLPARREAPPETPGLTQASLAGDTVRLAQAPPR